MTRRPSLAVRLGIAFVGVALAAVAALAGLTVWAVRSQVTEIAELRREEAADAVSEALADAYRRGDAWTEAELEAAALLAGTGGATVEVSGPTAGAMSDGKEADGGTGSGDPGAEAGEGGAGQGGAGQGGAGQGGAGSGTAGSGQNGGSGATAGPDEAAGSGGDNDGSGGTSGSGAGAGSAGEGSGGEVDDGGTSPSPGRAPSPGSGGTSSTGEGQAMLLPAATPGPRNGGPATLTRPIVVDGEEVGTVVIRFPAGSELSAPEAAALDALERIVLIGSVVAVLLAVLVATLVARRLTRPIRRMTTAASAIERGDLDARVGGSGPAELGDLANAFDRMAGALAREAELRRGLVADVAHELRTPVTILQGNLEEMVDGSLPATPIRLGSLHDEVLRLGRIVQDLETLAAAEAAGLELHRRTVDLAEVAGDAASLLEPWFSAAEVRLRPALSSVTVDGDPTRLNQIVTNLLTNALKFTPGGGAVEMVVRGDDGEAVLEVADTGPGIPSDELSHIFERFWRGSTARTTGGSGIGLSVVSELVHAHAGRIEATNAQGAGARFTVRIPAR